MEFHSVESIASAVEAEERRKQDDLLKFAISPKTHLDTIQGTQKDEKHPSFCVQYCCKIGKQYQ